MISCLGMATPRTLANLDCGFDTLETVRREGIHSGSFYNFQISQGRKIQAEVLESVGGLIYQQDIYREMLTSMKYPNMS